MAQTVTKEANENVTNPAEKRPETRPTEDTKLPRWRPLSEIDPELDRVHNDYQKHLSTMSRVKDSAFNLMLGYRQTIESIPADSPLRPRLQHERDNAAILYESMNTALGSHHRYWNYNQKDSRSGKEMHVVLDQLRTDIHLGRGTADDKEKLHSILVEGRETLGQQAANWSTWLQKHPSVIDVMDSTTTSFAKKPIEIRLVNSFGMETGQTISAADAKNSLVKALKELKEGK